MIVLLGLSLRAQATSTVTGLIRDVSGAVVPGAEVSVISVATGSARTVLTSETGTCRVTSLIPGHYEVAVSMAGFKTSLTQIEVTVGQVVHLKLTLVVGEITEQVIVTDPAALVDVEQGRVSLLTDQRRISDLPLNGRNVYQLMQLAPGAVNTIATVFEPGQGTNVNGGRANMNGFWMDGITTKGLSGGTGFEGSYGLKAGSQPNLEAIQEFRVETSIFSAEFGNSAASIVTVVSKSGGNQLHGSAYWFHRNDALDAREFFDKEVPEFKQNQYGFSLGGPIVRDKTFFFGSYEGTRAQSGESSLQAFESRNWSSYLTDYGRPVARFLYANYRAPELDSVTSTVGQYLTDSYIDSPDQVSVDAFLSETFGSLPGTLGADAPMTGEASFFTPESNDSDGFSLRIDQLQGRHDRLYGRYFLNKTDSQFVFARPAFNLPVRGGTHLLALNWLHTFGANLVNEARMGFTRNAYDESKGVPGILWIADVSLTSSFGSGGGPWILRENIFTWADTLSITKGDHGLKMGAEIRRNQQNSEFNVGGASYYLYDLVSLALDDPYYQGAGVDPHLDEGPGAELASNLRGWRGTEVGLFFNDDWKIRPNLTLNLGVRWDWYGRLTEVQNRATAFDMSSGNNIFERVYNGSFKGPVDKLSEDDLNNLAPRLGLAWDPFSDGRMSVRGGYGIAFQSGIFNPLANSRWNQPYYSFNGICDRYCGGADSILYGPQDETPVRVDGPNPNPGAHRYPGNIMAYDPSNPNISSLNAIPNPRMRDPYVQSFFVGIQRELVGNTSLEVNYVGTLGRKLLRAEDFNRYPGDLLGRPHPVAGEDSEVGKLNRINPGEGALRFWENSVSSNYHALQVQANRRFTKGLAVNASYTLAKSLDTRSTWHSFSSTSNRYQEGYSTDVHNQRLDYGRSIFDAHQRLTVSWLWDTNWFDSSQAWFLKNVLGGWQLNGIVALQSGQPFTPYSSWRFGEGGDWNADGWINDRPNTPAIGNNMSSERSDFVNMQAGIFDIPTSRPGQPPSVADKLAYFGEPESGANGNLGRNTYEGPGFAGVDFSLFKEVALSRLNKKARLQLRFELFNLFNRVNFFQPEPDITLTDFGRATEVFDAREFQMGIKLIF